MIINIDDIEYRTNNNNEIIKNPSDKNINAEDFKILSDLPKLNIDEIEDYLIKNKFNNINIKNSDTKIDITVNSPARLKSVVIKIYNRISNSYTAKILKETKIKIGDILSEEIILKLEKAATLNSTDVVRRILDEEGNVLIVVHAFSDLPTKINFIGLNTIKAKVLLDSLPVSRFYDKDFSSILQSYWLFRNTFDSSNIKDIEMRIMQNAKELGYFDFKILKCDFSNEVDAYLNKYLNIIIDEGSRYKISNIDIESEIPIDLELLDQIKNLANANCDKYFVYKKIISIQNKINQILQNNKIYNLICVPSCEHSEEKVQLKFELKDCHPPIIGSIQIFNNDSIRTSAIMRFIGLSEGDYYNEIMFGQYMAIIENIFKVKTNVSYKKLSQNKIGIMIDIIEGDNNSGGLTCSTSKGIDIGLKNIDGRAWNVHMTSNQLETFEEDTFNTSQTLEGMIFDGFKNILPTNLSGNFYYNANNKINIEADGVILKLLNQTSLGGSKLSTNDISPKYLTSYSIFDMFKSRDTIERERIEYYSDLLAAQTVYSSNQDKINFLQKLDNISVRPDCWQISGACQHKLSDNANISGGIKVGRQNCVIKGGDKDVINRVVAELYPGSSVYDNSCIYASNSPIFLKLFSSFEHSYSYNEDLELQNNHYIETDLLNPFAGKYSGKFRALYSIDDDSELEFDLGGGRHNYRAFTDNFNSSFNQNNKKIFNCGAKGHYQGSTAYNRYIIDNRFAKMAVYGIVGVYDLSDTIRVEPKLFCGIGLKINRLNFEVDFTGETMFRIYFN